MESSIKISSLLRSLAHKVLFYPNPGNAGDSLIFCATLQYFKKHNISYQIVNDNDFCPVGQTIVYGGGGNFGGSNSRVAKFLLKFKDSAKNIVILPHTIFKAEEIISQLSSNVYIFCRETVSFEHVRKNATNANVYLDEDMVFSSDLSKLMLIKPQISLINYFMRELNRKFFSFEKNDMGLSLKGYFAYLTYICLGCKKNEGTLHAYRTDAERTTLKIPPDNIDLSSTFELSACEPDLAKLSCYHFLNAINACNEIHTNRLHVAIAAAMLNKKVKLYSNNYYKVEAIYNHSIKEKYFNVEWYE